MSIREKIEFEISSSGISPAEYCDAGVQGDHLAANVIFKLTDDLFKELNTKYSGKLYYRFDSINGAGETKSSDPFAVEDKREFIYPLENQITRYGGNAEVSIVFTAIENEETEFEVYSFPALLRFKNSDTYADYDKSEYISITTAAQTAKNAAQRAEAAAYKAEKSSENIKNTKFALENGAEFVFSGGDAANNLKINYVIDDNISQYSENAVKNKAIAAELVSTYENAVHDAVEKAVKSAVEQAVKITKDAVYPIGSYYFSSKETSPEELFGGSWEQIKDCFILAAGDTYIVGETGGEAKHILTTDELPPHKHYTGSMAQNAGGAELSTTGKFGYQEVTLSKTSYGNYTNESGGGFAHNNMPPYTVAYCWQRIA